MPDLINAEASRVYAPNVNKLFVFGGDDPTTGTVVNTTRIYDIATNTWSTGTPMPDVRAFMASGYFNGKIYLVGGYTTGNVDPSFGQVWEYDPVANTFNTTRMSMPATLGGPGLWHYQRAHLHSWWAQPQLTRISIRCMTTTLRPTRGRRGPICPVASTCRARQ